MGVRRRHAAAVTTSEQQEHAEELGASGSLTSGTSLKFVLLACVLVLVLLVFAVSWKREEKGSCALCLRGNNGLMRKWREGDDGGQVVELAFAEEGDAYDDVVVGSIMSHLQVCPRLIHESGRSDNLMHALNNLMQRKYDSFLREEMDALPQKVPEMGRMLNAQFDPDRGNYEAEMLKAAAWSREMTVDFYDKVEAVEMIDLSGHDSSFLGLMLHLKARLWVAVSIHKGLWYEFDSTKATPLVFCEGAPGLHMFLEKVVYEGGLVARVLKPSPAAPPTSAQIPPPSYFSFEYWKKKVK